MKLVISSVRRILAPGEEEDFELEEEDAVTGAGSPEAFPSKVPGTLCLLDLLLCAVLSCCSAVLF